MLTAHILNTAQREGLKILQERCNQFLTESIGLPLLKNLSNKCGDFHKVKVRKRKGEAKEEFVGAFNDAFAEKQSSMRQRAIFANGKASFEPCYEHELEPFYIFPIDGYNYMYSSEVENSNPDYKKVIDLLFEEFGDGKGREIAVDLLKFTYKTDALYHGIQSRAEIIMYNIPFFYAVRKSTINNYSHFIKAILENAQS